MRNTKLKDLKYHANGIESPRPGLEVALPLIFIFVVVPICMIGIGLAAMYGQRIDDIPPKWQLIFTLVALAYPIYLGVVRVLKQLILKK
jgi:hypothetical protein